MHECCFVNNEELFMTTLKHAQDTLPTKFLAAFLNAKTTDQGFVALHFTSFKGNPKLSSILLANGADKYASNNMGITAVHVAA
jgi:ankyrin repeat protein